MGARSRYIHIGEESQRLSDCGGSGAKGGTAAKKKEGGAMAAGQVTPYGNSNSYGSLYGGMGGQGANKRRILIRDPFSGQVIASMSVSRASAKKTSSTSASLKKKRLNYKFKLLSNQILRAKTTDGARKAVSSARREIARLARNLENSEYDQDEVESALLHAKRMERIARKKMKHLAQEEAMQRGGEAPPGSDTLMEDMDAEGIDMEALMGMGEEELKALLEELEQTMEEMESGEYVESPSNEDLADSVEEGLDEGMDLQRLKRKHRTDEMREIVDADMKYLKALFQRLEREKASAGQSGSGSQSSGSSAGQQAPAGISLELGGAAVPVEAGAQPAPAEGGSVDVVV